jgi:hypothetical protein
VGRENHDIVVQMIKVLHLRASRNGIIGVLEPHFCLRSTQVGVAKFCKWNVSARDDLSALPHTFDELTALALNHKKSLGLISGRVLAMLKYCHSKYIWFERNVSSFQLCNPAESLVIVWKPQAVECLKKG